MKTPAIVRGNARSLPLPDESVDLIVTSPPYFGLRSYQDGGEHYDGQIGAEATPAEFIAALIACTREWVRVLKPAGSIFVNLGDKYAGSGSGPARTGVRPDGTPRSRSAGATGRQGRKPDTDIRPKSLLLLPERYRIAAVDELGLIARAVIVWSKPNGLPESVTDRVRRSHEDWVHLTKAPRYFAAVDEIREPYAPGTAARYASGYGANSASAAGQTKNGVLRMDQGGPSSTNALGKLPGSVWEIATQPLKVPAELGIDHFAAFPMEWPRRLILGWSPREVCTACGEGRRPVVDRGQLDAVAVAAISARRNSERNSMGADGRGRGAGETSIANAGLSGQERNALRSPDTITGYACACPDTSAPSTPGVVLDPFGGTGTTALVAVMHGRIGISVDLSADYCRLAQWRTSDPKQRERATQAKVKPPREVVEPEPIDLSDAPSIVHTDLVLAAISRATTRDALVLVWRANRDGWTDEHQLAVKSRLVELDVTAAVA